MRVHLLIYFIVLTMGVTAQSGFLEEQKRYSRVRNALEQKQQHIDAQLRANGLHKDSLHLLLIAYKAEKRIDIYAKKREDVCYSKIGSYPVCRSSGSLGPKRKQGDKQVPEGFYHIDRYNPASNYHLSLGINYPNDADKKKSAAPNPGGDIFIHGSCVTIGCLPVTDDKIQEIYLYAVYARNNGQTKIPVYIFPFEMTDKNLNDYSGRYSKDTALTQFWRNLKQGYDSFMQDKQALKISIDTNGDYLF